MASEVKQASIYVLGGHGYVWDAAEAHWLRLECGLVGAMVGGVAGFKQQNAVHGLPLQLGADEVTLALEKGWAVVQPDLGVAAQAAAAAAAAASKKRGRGGRGGFHGGDSDGELELEAQLEEEEEGAAAMANAEPPPWRAALSRGAPFTIPVAMSASSGRDAGGSGGAGGEGEGSALPPAASSSVSSAAAAVPAWGYPSTQEERHRYWVFRDLQQAGYRLTGGSKFGSDFLVYPGDPTLFHAQFCVRLLPLRAPLLPALLSASCRGSHQARKHLLLASVEEREGQEGEAEAAACTGEPGVAQQEQAAAEAVAGQPGVQLVEATAGRAPMSLAPPGSGGWSRAAQGQEFRIRYMTIGPVEGFG